jgi:AraC-like DNA-binding protein
MHTVPTRQVELTAYKAQAKREELVALIDRAVREDGTVEPLKGLLLQRSSSPREPLYGVSDPAFCVIAQGSKEVFLGHERYQYDPVHYLLITAELPLVGNILDASKERPYLSLRLKLDPALVGSVMAEAGHPFQPNDAGVRAVHVSTLEAGLLDAVVRLVGLLDTPSEAAFIAPLIAREIIYRLLTGEQADRLHHIASLSGHSTPIVEAIQRLRKDFDQPIRIDSIARDLGMSVSGFHRHFKAITAMSPLQFQKRVRLQEARRLMLGDGLDASNAAYRVGYNDASHFNREYKRLFGVPPMRDVERLRGTARQNGGLGAA